jgi:hypothetical protein
MSKLRWREKYVKHMIVSQYHIFAVSRERISCGDFIISDVKSRPNFFIKNTGIDNTVQTATFMGCKHLILFNTTSAKAIVDSVS